MVKIELEYCQYIYEKKYMWLIIDMVGKSP